jgi:hypothetical protein
MHQIETIISDINKIDPSVLSMESVMDKDGYLNRVYRFLQNLKPGQIYLVSDWATPETTKLFIAVVKMYMLEVKGNTISFIRDDYKKFRKNQIIT